MSTIEKNKSNGCDPILEKKLEIQRCENRIIQLQQEIQDLIQEEVDYKFPVTKSIVIHSYEYILIPSSVDRSNFNLPKPCPFGIQDFVIKACRKIKK